MMAEQIKTRITLEGGEEVKSTLQDIGKAGAAAFKSIQDQASKTDLDKVQAATASVVQGFKNVGAAALDTFKALGVITAGVGAVTAGLFALTNSASHLTNELRDAAIQSGTTAKSFAELSFAADQSGASAENLTRAFAVLNAGEASTEKALAKFGVRLKQANGNTRDAADVFRDFAAKISEIDDPAERTGAVVEVFGRRAGPKLVELLSEGEEGIRKLSAEANRLGLVFTQAELKVGDDFGDAISKLTKTFAALQARIGLAFGPAFIKLFDSVTEAIVRLTPAILNVANTLAGQFESAINSLTAAFGPLGVAVAATGAGIGGLGAALGVVLRLLAPFASLVTAAFTPFRLLLTGLTASTGLLVSSLTTLVNVVRLFGVTAVAAFGPWGVLIVAITAALGALALILAKNFDWEKFKQGAIDAWNGLQNVAAAAFDFIMRGWESLKNGAATAWNFITTTVTSALQSVLQFLQPIIDRLTQAWEIAKKFAAALRADGGGGGGEGFAGGGHVRGPGTTTSDSIWAKLSDQEFVMRAKAVKKYGVGFMNAINQMRFPADALRGFASGGLVHALSPLMPPVPRFADGGLVAAPASAGRPINLSIGGETFNLSANDEETAERLSRFAVSRQTRSAGRKPGWFGGGK